MGKAAFIFPGQGAQYVGMGKDFYERFSVSREVFDEADESLNMGLSSLCFEGDEDELKKTENTQPAILTTSIAILRAVEKMGIDCDYTAGLSLGEYSSLVKAESISFSDAVKVVKKRGKYMQEAVPEGKGGMAAILGLDKEGVLKAIEESRQYGVVEVANYNSPEQIVISGEIRPLNVACDKAKKLGAKKAVILRVSAPFHCKLLEPAGEKLKDELKNIDIFPLKKEVIANVDAKPVKRESIIPNLIKQVSSPVLWTDTISFMLKEGTDTFVEMGPGKSLTGFVKRIAKYENVEANAYNVSNIEEYNELCDFFNKRRY